MLHVAIANAAQIQFNIGIVGSGLKEKKIFFSYLPLMNQTALEQLKFGLSEKHTKFEKIFLMVWTNFNDY